MNKKIKSMEYVLIIGAVIIFFSLFCFLFSVFKNDYVKLLFAFFISGGYFLLSALINKVLKIPNSSKIYYGFGIVSIIISYIYLGTENLLGNWFSVNGDGSFLFIASIFFLIIILSIITKIKYKEFKYLNVIIYSGLLMIYFITIHFVSSHLIGFILIAFILLILNVIKINDQVSEIVKMAEYIFVIISLINLFSYEIILVSVLFLLNVITILILLNKAKDMETKLFSIIVISLNIIFYIISLSEEVEMTTCLAISTFIICILDLFVNCSNMLKNKFLEVAYKIIIDIILVFIVLCALSNETLLLIVISFFILITSLVKVYVLKNDVLEKNFVSYKIMLLGYSIINYLINYILMVDNYLVFLICNILSVIFYSISKDKILKRGYLITSILSLMLLMSSDIESIVYYIVSVILLILDYLIFIVREDKVQTLFGKIFYTLIVLVSYLNLEYLNIPHIKYLIIALIFVGLVYLTKESKYNSSITIPMFLLAIINYIDSVIETWEFKIITISLMIFITAIFFVYYLINKDKMRDYILAVICCLNILYILSGSTIITNIFALIVSLVILVLSMKNIKYKVSYYVGFVFTIISLLYLLDFVGDIPTSIYLFLIGIAIVTLMFILIYRYQNKEELIEEMKEERKVIYKTNYCSECGKRVSDVDRYCGVCGNKLK